MTVVSPACACTSNCSHHPDGKCTRFAAEKRKLCEACITACEAERDHLEEAYEERKQVLIDTQTGFADGEVTDPELIELYDRLKHLEKQMAVTR
jgi:dihydropteroate synthase